MVECRTAPLPAEQARQMMMSACDKNCRNQRRSLRSLKRVLALAKARGYDAPKNFLDSFAKAQTEDRRAFDRIMKRLYEYVSVDEISQLAQL